MAQTHQPGQAMFRSILPEDIEWKPFPAFPPSVRLAVVVGHPSEPGPYVIRVKVPDGVKLASSENAFWNSESERALAIVCASWRPHAADLATHYI